MTRRLVLRRGRREDAPLLKRAIDANLDHLRAWMPWAVEEPSPLEVIEERLDRFASDFDAAADWAFGIFPPDESAVIGGAGLHRRSEPDTLEIGYWIDARHTRRGYATEATEALMQFGFSMPEIERIEIRCDPRNIASAGVPKKLGFRHIATLENDTTTPTGDPRDTMVWEMTRPSFRSTPRNPRILSMTAETTTSREMLRHAVATLAYRASKAMRNAPADFASFKIGDRSRTPGQIVSHMCDLLDWATWLARGEHRWNNSTPGDWDADVARFFTSVQTFDDYLASDAPLGRSAELLFQGPVADALTHTGQLTMLRRLAGSPIRGESYARADVAIGRVGFEQSPPRVEFD